MRVSCILHFVLIFVYTTVNPFIYYVDCRDNHNSQLADSCLQMITISDMSVDIPNQHLHSILSARMKYFVV